MKIFEEGFGEKLQAYMPFSKSFSPTFSLPLYQYLVLSLTVVILLILILRKLRRMKIGKAGENMVTAILSTLPDSYDCYTDIRLTVGKQTAQIDHIVISTHGIFVIEVKNYGGVVCGRDNADSIYWYQYRDEHKRQFYSPVCQNKTHVELLSAALGLDKKCFLSVIVFTGKAKLKIRHSLFRHDSWIVKPEKLSRFIRRKKAHCRNYRKKKVTVDLRRVAY